MIDCEGQRKKFLRRSGAAEASVQALPSDASPRRYFRVDHPRFGSVLLMQETPGNPDLPAYLLIASYLRDLKLSAPIVHDDDTEAGFALIEDFGNATYTRLLEDGADETALYELAVETLVKLHNEFQSGQITRPSYDAEALRNEYLLFADWFASLFIQDQELVAFQLEFDRLWRKALRDVSAKCETLVLLDFHVDNLMLLDGRNGVASCGLLDFQDAMIGACAYDLMSLAQDARRDLSEGLEEKLLNLYFSLRSDVDRKATMQDYHLLAAQRHTKVAGIFMRLSRRDGKHGYLAHIPRVLRQLDASLDAAGLHEILTLIDQNLPAWRDCQPTH
jgi:aminoglycoside/choline kinase family phosphotransferase